ncbi:hypothetical protein C5S31_07145, partial [ANME-1 cluster archaeon GoMg2]|nr:hypothetical protein [ANME-1 cluster archaeon GoMg2]
AFEVGKEFIDEYVWATICSKKQMIGIYYRAKDQDTAVLIKKFEYELNEEVKDLRPDEAVPQSKNSGKRKTNRALNPKRSDIFMVKINCGTASDIFKTL